MSHPNRDELLDLWRRDEPPAVSIYLPTHRAGPQIRQDPIRLKNLLKEASRRLAAAGLDTPAAEAILEPAFELVGDVEYWRHQSDGLAVFADSGHFAEYRLPISFVELVVVGPRFHLKPLLRLLSGDGRFYVLALSEKRIRLFEASRDRCAELDVGDAMPTSLAEAVGGDWEQRSLQLHTGTGGSGQGAKRAAVFHGQGMGGNEEQREVEQLLHRVDAGLRELAGDPAPPLVVAAAEPMLGMFRNLTRYPALIDEALVGNHDDATAGELHGPAWDLVEPIFERPEAAARERLEELLETDRVCSELPEVLRSAVDGRIDSLFVAVGRQAWGSFDRASREVELAEGAAPGEGDLLDLAAIEAIQHGGDVYAVPADEVPGGGAVAGLLRY